jgi:hypothetical protein
VLTHHRNNASLWREQRWWQTGFCVCAWQEQVLVWRGWHTRQGSLCHAQDGSQHILDLVQLGEQDLEFETLRSGQKELN